MRQVPSLQFLIIGNGRASKHMGYYLNQLQHQVTHWHHRNDLNIPTIETSPEKLKEFAHKNDRILLLIKDSAIASFLDQYPFLRTTKTIHFSGSLEITGIANVHPLVSFGNNFFDINFYEQIPFAHFDSPSQSLSDTLPGLPNPSFYIPRTAKSLYHALCVASGNLTVLLWHLVALEFKKKFSIEEDYLKPYLESVFLNLKTNWDQALTGPIARRDELTLSKNYSALQDTVLKEIFMAHTKLAWPEFALKYFNSPPVEK